MVALFTASRGEGQGTVLQRGPTWATVLMAIISVITAARRRCLRFRPRFRVVAVVVVVDDVVVVVVALFMCSASHVRWQLCCIVW